MPAPSSSKYNDLMDRQIEKKSTIKKPSPSEATYSYIGE
jgi:hypothetical protein